MRYQLNCKRPIWVFCQIPNATNCSGMVRSLIVNTVHMIQPSKVILVKETVADHFNCFIQVRICPILWALLRMVKPVVHPWHPIFSPKFLIIWIGFNRMCGQTRHQWNTLTIKISTILIRAWALYQSLMTFHEIQDVMFKKHIAQNIFDYKKAIQWENITETKNRSGILVISKYAK